MPEINLVQTLDSQSKNMQVDVRVITLDDNLFHPYFTSIDISKNNLSPIGSAVAITLYSPDIFKYWTKYTGTIIFSFNMKELKHINTNSTEFAEAYKLPQRLENNQYNYSFIGKISKLKRKGKKIIIYFEDLGWKFLQKVPMEFRQQYIAGQPLDKAFQSICEFLGVEFAFSIADLQKYTFGGDGYSIQKEGQTIETVETVLSEWKTQEEKEKEENPLDDKYNENPSLIEFDKKNKNNKDYQRNDVNKEKNIESTNNDKEEDNNLQQEEFDKKILNLFIGNTFYESELTTNIMNYNNITVQPTNTNTDTNTITTENNQQGENQDNQGTPNLDPSTTQIGLQNLKIKNTTPVLSSHNKKALGLDYIRTLTTAQAADLAKQTNLYDTRTIKRLRRRAIGAFW